MMLVFLFTTRVYQYIIYEDNNKGIQVRSEHFIHQVHRRFWGICQSKRHYQKLIIAIMYSKSCLRDILCPNLQLMIT
ncbi:hypothetical protein R3W88_024426 [Solanum pinnatisectum]|uniref:Uncharacterized protein n=1 Tax=Solanum pinnatisectum TaxID=50273 RepID=A0AAV9M064_9SOLN|nr:hypothetical protein R3W88_024426 [Solanum pinnatisectum]